MKKLINRIKYRIRKFFNIKNDIPKLMSQIEIDLEDRFSPPFIDFFIGEEVLTPEEFLTYESELIRTKQLNDLKQDINERNNNV